jgi:hypothetical protein
LLTASPGFEIALLNRGIEDADDLIGNLQQALG